MKDYIYVNEPVFNGNEKEYLNKCIDTGFVSSGGEYVKEFEDNFSNYIGLNYGSAVSNGTTALDLAFESLDLKEGDEIIMPSFAIISCILPLIRKKLKPIFIDVDKFNFNIKVDEIENKITNKTKAILVVHTYGLPVDMYSVMNIAKKNNLKIIEDCAEVIGLDFDNLKCGNFSDVSTFSFYPNKHITTGEGGMVCTNDQKIKEKIDYYKNLCFSSKRRFVHKNLGWNYRISNLQAAVGCAQLEMIDNHIKKKRIIGDWYNELFKDSKYFHLPIPKEKFSKNIYWVYTLLIKDHIKIDAKSIINELDKLGVGARPFFFPLHKQPVFKSNDFYNLSLPNTEIISEKGFYIPSGLNLDYKTAVKVHEIVQIAISNLI